MNEGHKDLKVYQLAYRGSMEVFNFSKCFPREELYSLTDQIRRSSRSVCANIGEGYRKRAYPKHFASKMSDADGECTETLIWLDYAKDCGYLSGEMNANMERQYVEIGRMLGSMINNPEKFLPKNSKR